MAKRLHERITRQFVGTVLFAGDEVKQISIEIPGRMSDTGEPFRFTFEIHNTYHVPLAYDIELVHDPSQKPSITIREIIREPNDRENGEAHHTSGLDAQILYLQ